MNGVYAAASGMLADRLWLDAVGSNLANANAPGYLAQSTAFQAFPVVNIQRTGGPNPSANIGTMAMSVAATPYVVNQSLGFQTTGRSLDLALSGPGFFTVKTPTGIAYTKDGQFYRDAQGTLVDSQGNPVLSTNGQTIHVGTAPFSVNPTGVILQNGAPLAVLQINDLSGPIAPLSGTLYQGKAALDTTSTVVQGALNTSGASLTHEAVAMIQAETAYQGLTGMLTTESSRLNQTATLGLWA